MSTDKRVEAGSGETALRDTPIYAEVVAELGEPGSDSRDAED